MSHKALQQYLVPHQAAAQPPHLGPQRPASDWVMAVLCGRSTTGYPSHVWVGITRGPRQRRMHAELPALGGVDVLADAMLEGGTMRLQAMRVLATAAANNVPFQEAVLKKEAGTVQWLLQVRPGSLGAACVFLEHECCAGGRQAAPALRRWDDPV